VRLKQQVGSSSTTATFIAHITCLFSRRVHTTVGHLIPGRYFLPDRQQDSRTALADRISVIRMLRQASPRRVSFQHFGSSEFSHVKVKWEYTSLP
jgi:hypothetical protein